MDSKSKPKRIIKKFEDINFKPLLSVMGILALLFTLYLSYRFSISNKKTIFPFSIIALFFAGMLFEGFRISENLKNFIFTFIVTWFFSLIPFVLNIQESNFNFDSPFLAFISFFIFLFTILIGVFNKDRVTAQLTEGITLVLSLSLIYWIIDYGFINLDNWFVKSILIISLLFSAFSIINALTHFKLSKLTRLTLSIWSTVIMVSFAIDNIYRVLSNRDIENTDLSLGVSIGLQYFLLGVSAIYIMKNFMLLVSLFPNKNGDYKDDLKEIRKEHIDRYSNKQVNTMLSLFCILYSGTIYILNYKFQMLPRHTMIWFVFFSFPLITYFTNRLNENQRLKSALKN